jgi:uncharacterized membrane protein
MLLTALLAWLHVISAIAWLGGGIMFGFVIAPTLSKFSPPASGEFLVKVGPRVARFFQVIAGTTILFGALLLYNLGGFGLLTPSNTYGIELTIGVTFALIAFVVSEFFGVPPLLKAVRLIREMQSAGRHEPPAELPKALRVAAATATLTVVLLILTSVFMVAAGFY